MDKSNTPTHRAYCIQGEGEKASWREIGALWAHKDSKGFSFKLDMIPVNGGDIVIRMIEPKTTLSKALDDGLPDAENGG